jgi:hypothetical protein
VSAAQPGGFDPFRAPMIGAHTWTDAMTKADWRCECTGRCGKPHTKTEGRCGTVHGTAHRLAVVAADPLATLTDAVSGTELVALCMACDSGARRAAITTQCVAVPAQPDLFDTTGIEAA